MHKKLSESIGKLILDECTDEIVREEMNWLIKSFKADLAEIANAGTGFVFSLDAAQDKKEIHELMLAAIRIRNYYSISSDQLDE
jgi:hypothetical protein